MSVFVFFVWFPGLLAMCFHFFFFFAWPSVVSSVLLLLGFVVVVWLSSSLVSEMHSRRGVLDYVVVSCAISADMVRGFGRQI